MQTVIAPEVTKGLGTSKKIFKRRMFSDNTLATNEHNQQLGKFIRIVQLQLPQGWTAGLGPPFPLPCTGQTN